MRAGNETPPAKVIIIPIAQDKTFHSDEVGNGMTEEQLNMLDAGC
jgi:hypothetical protein